MRLFTAIELPPHARAILASWQNALRLKIRPRVSWTQPRNLHVTLKFMGQVAETQAPRIIEALTSCQCAQAMRLSIGALMTLPPRGTTRIIAASIVDGQREISELFDKIENALVQIGIPRDGRRFTPHITLGRVRERSRVALTEIQLSDPRTIALQADEFVLMQSTQSPAGSKYDVLARFPLKCASA